MRLILATSAYPSRPDEAINAGVFVRDIAAELAGLGHELHVLTPDKGEPITGSPAPVTTFAWGGSEKVLTRLNPRRPADLVRLGRLLLGGRSALRELARRVQAEAVLAMWAIPAGFWAGAAPLPYAVWALGSDIWGAHRYPFGRAVVRGVLRGARHVFADGLDLAARAGTLAGQTGAVEVLLSSRRLPLDTPPAALPPGQFHCVFVGRWDEVKGVDILLEAMERLGAWEPAIHLHLFGGGPLQAWIKERAAAPSLRTRVTVYGFADPATVAAYLKAADCLVIASRMESIPLVYSDALQCGCPVVTTAVGDLGRLVDAHGTGRVCPPEDPDALAEAILALAAGGDRPRERLATRLAQAYAAFDLRRSARRCVEALAEPLAGGAGKRPS